jgi:hypothetical protein
MKKHAAIPDILLVFTPFPCARRPGVCILRSQLKCENAFVPVVLPRK